MKAIKSILPVLILLASCGDEKKETAAKPAQSKLEAFTMNFIKENPNYEINRLVQVEVGQKLKQEYFSKLNEGLISDYPLELQEIQKVDGRNYAHFSEWGRDIAGVDTFRISLDIICEVTNEAVDTLKEKAFYKIDGKNPKDIGDISTKYGTSFFNPNFEIKKGISGVNRVASYGVIRLDLQSITSAPEIK